MLCLLSTGVWSVLAVYILEAGLTLYSPESARLTDWSAKNHNLLTKEEMLQKLRSEGTEATLSLVPKFLLHDTNHESLFPLGGMAKKTTVFCNETGNWSIYESDEHGFNNPKNMYKPRLDALLVGESFVHGACVAPDKNITAHVRKRFPATLSLGMDGNGEITTLASLMEYGPWLKPARVIWVYAENTLGRANDELANTTLKHYMLDNHFQQDLQHQQPAIDALWQAWLDSQLKARTPQPQSVGFSVGNVLRLHYVRHYYEQFRYAIHERGTKGNAAENEQRLKDILTKARNLTQSWGGELYFVYLATASESSHTLPSDHEQIIAIAKSVDIPVIDSYALIKAQAPQDINAYQGKGHYNEKGYALFSSFLLSELEKHPPQQNLK